MEISNSWRHYYLSSGGKLKKKPKNFLPKYLRRTKSLASMTTNSASSVFRGWNRSAYFRFKANNQSTNSDKSDSGYSGSSGSKSVSSSLTPLFSGKTKSKQKNSMSA